MNTVNLLKLADELEKPLPKNLIFDMYQWLKINAYDKSFLILKPYQHNEAHNGEIHCDTVCCALGFSVFIPGLEPLPDESSWDDYCARLYNLDTIAYVWCFHSEWRMYDNTPQGAAKRIRYMLTNGLPEDFDYPSPRCVELYAN